MAQAKKKDLGLGKNIPSKNKNKEVNQVNNDVPEAVLKSANGSYIKAPQAKKSRGISTTTSPYLGQSIPRQPFENRVKAITRNKKK